ncbi:MULTISPECIES: DNA primase [unclassified Corynebacterium]|uniref:DNA primase n=1 Tax=unclassified Corynebacterium TaxID=2624378 RepID=UPI0008A3B6C1|nr:MULTISPECIES: DNA primase [unclassified Corynebacterium]OFN75755.1 DNA primase [Corynebacterium sp. HMSC074E01]OFP67304.1 DNA primase [Corynebacterium sp. HMSC074C01]OHO60768.1 DNA primase [Corynebacterium sp. HMSC036D02]
MSFFEDIASALDGEGIESRVNDDVMFVPITSDLEIQFVEIDPILPAANVYIAAADVDEDDEDFEAVLVSVAFSVEDAVEAVSRHIATDQVVTVLRDLLEGTDERIAELEFLQDEFNPNLVVAEVANDSELRVLVETIDGVPSAIVRFLSFDFDEEELDELEDEAISKLWEIGTPEDMSEEERVAIFGDAEDEEGGLAPIIEVPAEALELGTYTDFDRLFDVLSLVSDQALDWEAQLVSIDDSDFDEPEVYDIFGADDDDDDDVLFDDVDDDDDDYDEDETEDADSDGDSGD